MVLLSNKILVWHLMLLSLALIIDVGGRLTGNAWRSTAYNPTPARFGVGSSSLLIGIGRYFVRPCSLIRSLISSSCFSSASITARFVNARKIILKTFVVQDHQ